MIGFMTAGAAPALPARAADAITDGQWYVDFLHLRDAHQITRGAGVTVAVIDTGVNAHPDLVGNLLPGVDVLAGSTGDGRTDVHGHGTSMAGLIGGHGRVLGVAPEATILPVRVGRIDVILDDNLVKGIDWAVANGAKVLNLSLATTDANGLEDAVRRAIAADVVIVAGIGNTNKDSTMRYPARYPGVVAVGGVDRHGDHSAISVEGSQMVLSAPSDLISSLRPQGDYGVGTGTSDATALVAGAAALVRAKFPQLSAAEVVHRLTATADDRGPAGRDDTYGYGIVNVVKALTADVPPATTAPPSRAGNGDRGTGGRLIVGIVGGVVFVLAMVILGVVFLRRR